MVNRSTLHYARVDNGAMYEPAQAMLLLQKNVSLMSVYVYEKQDEVTIRYNG